MTLALFVVAAMVGGAPLVAAPVVDQVAPVVVRIIPAAATPERYQIESVCRSSIETGSLIKKHKACLTAKQWDYVDQAHREEARKMMLDNMGKAVGIGQ